MTQAVTKACFSLITVLADTYCIVLLNTKLGSHTVYTLYTEIYINQ